ncbi:murein hydrolase activator EnvC family protein [Paenibacillus cymbidii]|uniref:murein hydrolase activator EnvC family protein n=1 Tax=Paenibacillus cymbidii TaxID=1639034 RepID=UPI001080B973|nr:peptidoglycan DD-metalloendopeptidase family protein [Paenibacillus cymbidii]
MKKTLLPLFVALALIGSVALPDRGMARSSVEIQKQIDATKKKEAENAKKQQEADQLAASLKKQQEQEATNLDALRADMKVQGDKVNDLNTQIIGVNQTLVATGQQLDEAEDRVDSRDKLLKSRVRLMYMNGSVSYLDVILSAKSFADFIDRFTQLGTIVGSDKTILEANKQDRDLIVVKKAEVEKQLAQLQTLYAQAQEAQATLQAQEKRKQVLIASLDKQVKTEESISDEAEAQIVALAKQRQALNDEMKAAQAAENRAKAAAQAAQTPAFKGGKFGWPLAINGIISDPYGYRIDPIAKVRKLHKGVDIAAPNGTAILAAEAGTVLIASWTNGYGNTVVLDHGGGYWTWYGHIRENGIKVDEGDTVKKGQKIAEVGSTGDSTGNHLHFEVRINGEATDPMPYLGAK